MALDYGEARIGVAVSDPTGMFAQPLEAIAPRRPRGDRPRGESAALDRIAELAAHYAVERIVLGLPLRMDGSTGPQVERTRAFGARVARRTGLPVEYLDERWSSQQAERVLAEGGVRARDRKGRVDPIAAALILQTWMDRDRDRGRA
jgi:putative Holliday junction resolvase